MHANISINRMITCTRNYCIIRRPVGLLALGAVGLFEVEVGLFEVGLLTVGLFEVGLLAVGLFLKLDY